MAQGVSCISELLQLPSREVRSAHVVVLQFAPHFFVFYDDANVRGSDAAKSDQDYNWLSSSTAGPNPSPQACYGRRQDGVTIS
jgi:hypothetical protein